jgi:hypothetical protein
VGYRKSFGLVTRGDSKLILKDERNDIIAAASINALSGAVRLDQFNVTKQRGVNLVSYGDYEKALVLRSIVRHLKRRLRIKMPDRNRAVRGVITSLLDSTPMSIIRCDIKSFYESVFIQDLKDRLLFDTASSATVRKYFESYFDSHCTGKVYGLPRGAGLSAVLAEIAIRSFDERVRALSEVYRYFRYADDIVVFTLDDPTKVLGLMGSVLPKGMRFNRAKTEFCDLTAPKLAEGQPSRPSMFFDYLGYIFNVEDESGKGKSRRVELTMSDSKIDRLKTRMILSLKDFERNHDGQLLIDRVRFIASNYKVRRTGNTHVKGSRHIKSGIYYNYSLCGSYTVTRKLELTRAVPKLSALKALDGMLRGLVTGNSTFRPNIMANMTPAKRQELLDISFASGFERKMLFRVTPGRVAVIKRAWRNA